MGFISLPPNAEIIWDPSLPFNAEVIDTQSHAQLFIWVLENRTQARRRAKQVRFPAEASLYPQTDETLKTVLPDEIAMRGGGR